MAYLKPGREHCLAARRDIDPRGAWWLAWQRVQAGLREVFARLPSSCPLCQDPAYGGCLCALCRQDVLASRLAFPCCERCGLCPAQASDCPDCIALVPAFEKVIAACDYAFPADQLIRQFKQQHRFQHSRALAALIAQSLQGAMPEWWGQAWLVPIPASRQALLRRGFNPAVELARGVQVHLGARVRTDILLRSRETGAERVQKRLQRSQRLQAAGQAFVCRQNLAQAHIVLVDDVMTTGATLHAAASVLRQAGAKTVWGVVAARTPYHVR